jgi:glucose-6-phosphate isomerase
MSAEQTSLRVYYGNVMSQAVGPEHGLRAEELEGLASRVGGIVEQIEAGRSRGERRYRELPYDEPMIQGVEAACAVRRGKYENLVVLGIGGSALGNIALQTALNSPMHNLLAAERRRGARLFVMDNVDPVQFGSLLEWLDGQLERTCFNVISKSGETAETASQFTIVRDLLRRRLGAEGARDRIVVTTDPQGGTMRRVVEAERYDALPVPPGVGGRFSVLSPVGLFSAAMCGIDIRRLLAGAGGMDLRVRRAVLRENPAALLAAVHYLYMQRGKKLHVMMPYSYQLKDLADWFRQLWAESLGKRKTLDGRDAFVGPTPIRALGATDQHSQIQLYREGPNDKVITTLAVEQGERDVAIPPGPGEAAATAYLAGASMGRLLQTERVATERALVESERPVLTVRFPRVCEETVGQFIYLYECATSILGLLLNVNAYDQPAVELGKRYTMAMMGQAGLEALGKELAGRVQVDSAYLV